jgi:hypothetical protein
MQHWDEAELAEFLRLLGLFVHGRAACDSLELQPRISLRKLKNTAEYEQARGFFITNLVRLDRQWKLPETLLSSASICYVLLLEDQTCALCEFSLKESSYTLVQFISAPPQDHNPLLITFLEKALLCLQAENPQYKIILPRQVFDQASLELVGKHASLAKYLLY